MEHEAPRLARFCEASGVFHAGVESCRPYVNASSVRALTPVELALAFALGGSVLAVGLPAFVRNLHASRMVEALNGVEKLATRAAAQTAFRPLSAAFPESAPLTPAEVPRATLVTDPPGTWDHPTWRRLDFALTEPHAYSFEFKSDNAPSGATFHAQARGDLDGDGVLSTFDVPGKVDKNGEAVLLPLELLREIE